VNLSAKLARIFTILIACSLGWLATNGCVRKPTADDGNVPAATEASNNTKLQLHKVIQNFQMWAADHAKPLEALVSHAKGVDTSNPARFDPQQAKMNPTQAFTDRLKDFHDYLVCNSPMRDLAVFGSVVTPSWSAMLSKVPAFSKLPTPTNPAVARVMGRMGANPVAAVFINGLHLSNGPFSWWALVQPLVNFGPFGVSNVVFGDYRGRINYAGLGSGAGALPIPIPKTSIILHASTIWNPGADIVVLMLAYNALPQVGVGPLNLGLSGGVSAGFSFKKIAQVTDLRRWNGTLASDCGQGPEKQRQSVAVRAEREPPLESNAPLFREASVRERCLKPLKTTGNLGHQTCNRAALVTDSASIARCLAGGGGRACLMEDGRCGPTSGGGFSCNIENAVDCLCNGGGVACFRPGQVLNQPERQTDKHICRPM
jgi:hypothetical protein